MARTHGLSRTPEYKTWKWIVKRCYNERCKAYPLYGGRGIKMSDEWRRDPVAFIADMGPKPSPHHSVERIDNAGPYSKENCCWATPKEQARNRRSNRRVDGKVLAVWSEEIGANLGVLRTRIKRGLPLNSPKWTPLLEGVNIKALAKSHGIKPTTLSSRIHSGKTLEEALSIPARVYKKTGAYSGRNARRGQSRKRGNPATRIVAWQGDAMTLEEIEARWKAATPGPWTFDAGRGGIASGMIDVINPDDGFVSISDEDAKAIAAAPTDIAYLLERVREFENELVECGRRESVERALAHVRSARVHELEDRVRKLERAHAWFVENTEYGMSSDEGGGLICHCGYYEPFSHEPKKHEPDCEWVKAKDLRL